MVTFDFNLILSISYNVHPMNSPFLDLLKRIADGIVIYEPFPRDSQGMREFQDTVNRLQEMEQLGFIGRLFIQTRSSQGEEYIDLVMVQGGLTLEGKQLLAEQEGQLLTGQSSNEEPPE